MHRCKIVSDYSFNCVIAAFNKTDVDSLALVFGKCGNHESRGLLSNSTHNYTKKDNN